MKTIKREKFYNCIKKVDQVKVTMLKTVWRLHTDDFDFHVSHSLDYNTKEEAKKALQEFEQDAHYMGDNKYFFITKEEKTIVKVFDIDENKRIKRYLARQIEKDDSAQLVGVLLNWEGQRIAYVHGTIYELMDYGEKIWGGDKFLFKDVYGEIYRYKSVLKIEQDN